MSEDINGSYVDYIDGKIVYYKVVVNSEGVMTLYPVSNNENEQNLNSTNHD